MDALSLLRDLVAIPGPPGQEGAVRRYLADHLSSIGRESRADAKGNLLVGEGRVVVTAHMDEIAMIVREVFPDGSLRIGALGGLYPWKLGEGPVLVMGIAKHVAGVLSFGSIHTEDASSNVRRSEEQAIDWDHAVVQTCLDPRELDAAGVTPGTRVVVHPDRRQLLEVGDHVGSYFLDDRADLVAWLLAQETGAENATFVATTSEEVGGHGALYAFHRLQPEVCIALELGPEVEDATVDLSPNPTLWVNDGYAAMDPADIAFVRQVAEGIDLEIQYQALSRGGSDASCAASHGLCARPITLGIPVSNSHGFEICHPEAIENLARLTIALVEAL
ncbi:MAG: hypothetical protein JSS66_15360 [Armatimonadetes bacterium]|nr:hypothetical protein [Armatimonadota bacterium]